MGIWRRVFGRAEIYSELSEEMRAHLDEKVEELVGEGMSRKDAEAAARREFGNLGLIEEDGRAAWRWEVIEDFWADVKYGMRGLRKNLGFTVVALLTIAIGIGANAAVFSVVDAVMLRPLRYPNSQELVALRQAAPGAGGLTTFCRWTAACRLRCISRIRSRTGRFRRWECGVRGARTSRASASRSR